MTKIRRAFSWLFHSKYGKLLPVLLLAGMMITASATVFELYYANTTATVRASDVVLVAGPDASASCAKYPCATVSLSSTNDYATINLSFEASATNNPQPATYYTNLLQVHNGGTAAHTVMAVSVNTIAQTGTDLGSITIYYCTAQTDSPATSANCASFTFTSTTGGSLSGNSILPATLAASGTHYIEIVATAATTAAVGDKVTFIVQIQWQ